LESSRWIGPVVLVLAACGGRSEPLSSNDGGNAAALEASSAPADSPAYLTCLNASGKLDPSLKTCQADVDCVAKVEFTDCCGSILYVGVNTASVSEFDPCEASWEAHFLGPCLCQPKPTQTEDGHTLPPLGMDASGPEVRCTDLTMNGGLCMTFTP
jgi:hypothetical protein